MRFENTQVTNFNNAFRGMRNPLESWEAADSFCGLISFEDDIYLQNVADRWMNYVNQKREKNNQPLYKEATFEYFKVQDYYMDWLSEQGTLSVNRNCVEVAYIGPKDLSLAQKLIRAGSSDRKFMRQIFVSVDITAPLYFWKEFDTYKVGTVSNSTSTMHKLSTTPITKECFEMGDFDEDLMIYENSPFSPDICTSEFWNMFINDLETIRQKYQETKDKRYWKELIRLLPESWLQTRTITLNYQILRNIYSQRINHKLSEWHKFCDWIITLPYAGELITINLA